MCLKFAQAIRTRETAEIRQELAELATDPETDSSLKALVSALQAILAGSRDPALAAEPALDYRDAAEILWLVEGGVKRET